MQINFLATVNYHGIMVKIFQFSITKRTFHCNGHQITECDINYTRNVVSIVYNLFYNLLVDSVSDPTVELRYTYTCSSTRNILNAFYDFQDWCVWQSVYSVTMA